jgi:hypothetical protein
MQAIDMAISLRLAGSLNEIINAYLFFVLMLLCGASGVALAMTIEPMGALLRCPRNDIRTNGRAAREDSQSL